MVAGLNDKFEDLYRIQVTEPSIVTMLLQPKDKVDLDLYLLNGLPGGAAPTAVGGSATDGTDPEASQVALGPGTYYIVVTAWECELADPRTLGERLWAALPPP